MVDFNFRILFVVLSSFLNIKSYRGKGRCKVFNLNVCKKLEDTEMEIKGILCFYGERFEVREEF